MPLAINAFRLVTGYVDHVQSPGGGVVAYLGDLASWHHVLKDGLFATQELFGDAVAVSTFQEADSSFTSVTNYSAPDLPLLGDLEPELQNHSLPFHTLSRQYRPGVRSTSPLYTIATRHIDILNALQAKTLDPHFLHPRSHTVGYDHRTYRFPDMAYGSCCCPV